MLSLQILGVSITAGKFKYAQVFLLGHLEKNVFTGGGGPTAAASSGGIGRSGGGGPAATASNGVPAS